MKAIIITILVYTIGYAICACSSSTCFQQFAFCNGQNCECRPGFSGSPGSCTCSSPKHVTYDNQGIPHCLDPNACLFDWECTNFFSRCTTNNGVAEGTCVCKDNFVPSASGCTCNPPNHITWVNGQPNCVPPGSCFFTWECPSQFSTCSYTSGPTPGTCGCVDAFIFDPVTFNCTCDKNIQWNNGVPRCVSPTRFVGNPMTGANEAPPNNSPGIGNSVVIFDPETHTLRVTVFFSNLAAPSTVAHIHCCTATPLAGTAGVATQLPSFTGFPTGVTFGSYDQTFNTTLASTYNPAFVTANGGTPATAEAALYAGILGGRAYINIHTTAFPNGEIRAFLLPG